MKMFDCLCITLLSRPCVPSDCFEFVFYAATMVVKLLLNNHAGFKLLLNNHAGFKLLLNNHAGFKLLLNNHAGFKLLLNNHGCEERNTYLFSVHVSSISKFPMASYIVNPRGV
ncbi:unnamed protein product [Cuscuta epithymum]|uniref:Uncharacterized protein n=1 Tax=Cuscuta epithymum TaxID=186058 RepID=A0AAV0G5P8_9ASTE|nr:unnamed protein product [Cuscuta epithymum]CAH9143235.1 unnamed protein product [Cuscuta epithymum]